MRLSKPNYFTYNKKKTLIIFIEFTVMASDFDWFANLIFSGEITDIFIFWTPLISVFYNIIKSLLCF